MGRQIRTGVTVVKRDHVDRYRLADRRHRRDDGVMTRHRHHLANRLLDLACGE